MNQDEIILSALARLTSPRTFRKYGAHSIGMAVKEVGGKRTDRKALTFFVPCKLPTSSIPPGRRVPRELHVVLPGHGADATVETDVIELPTPEPLALPPGAAHRPIPGGVRCYLQSSGHSGTFGGWVWDKTDDSVVFLSNQHVLGDNPGDLVNQPNSDIFAPAGETYRIGRVKRAAGLTPAEEPFTPEMCNFADASIGDIDDTDDVALTVLDIGPAVFQIENVAEDMSVEKSGQISGHTVGHVTTYPVNTLYEFEGIGTVVMCDLFTVRPDDQEMVFSSQGDSGSLIFRRNPDDEPNPCVGLLFGGGGSAQAKNQWSQGCRIQSVFHVLDLDVLCSGGFSALLDALLSGDEDHVVEEYAYSVFSPKPRSNVRSMTRGMARDVQARLRTTPRGREITDFVQTFRTPLLKLLISSRDIRRAAIHALRPILRGALTVDRLFARKISEEDLRRLGCLMETVEAKASDDLKRALKPFQVRLGQAVGRTIAELV